MTIVKKEFEDMSIIVNIIRLGGNEKTVDVLLNHVCKRNGN